MAIPTPVKKKVALPGEDIEDQVQQTAMGKLAQGLEGPSQGLQTSIGQGRSAVAQFAADTGRATAAQAVKGGALGQGTQTSLMQGARQSVMSQLGKNEANNAQMVSDEGKAFMDKALDIGQQNKQLKQNQNQFDVTAGQEDKKIANQETQFNTSTTNQVNQFQTTAGQNQQQIDAQKDQFAQTLATNKDQFAKNLGMENTKLIASLGADIPAVATKLMTTAMGQTGQPLSPAEKADLQKWYDDAKAKGDKMDAQMDTLITKMITEATAPKGAMSTLADTQANDQLTTDTLTKKLASGEALTKDDYDAGIKANAFPQFTAATIPKAEHVNEFLQKNPNGVVNIGGTPYKVVQGDKVRTGAGTFTNQERHTDVVTVQDTAGNVKYIYDGKINDKMPKKVSNDISPFGF